MMQTRSPHRWNSTVFNVALLDFSPGTSLADAGPAWFFNVGAFAFLGLFLTGITTLMETGALARSDSQEQAGACAAAAAAAQSQKKVD